MSSLLVKRESKKDAGHVVFAHFKENPRGVQDITSLFIPKRIQEGYRTCRLYSFQRESKSDTGHVVFAHSKENPRGVQDMSYMFS